MSFSLNPRWAAAPFLFSQLSTLLLLLLLLPLLVHSGQSVVGATRLLLLSLLVATLVGLALASAVDGQSVGKPSTISADKTVSLR